MENSPSSHNESRVEKLIGSRIGGAGITGFTALIAATSQAVLTNDWSAITAVTVALPMVPDLIKSIPAHRHRDRVVLALSEIECALQELKIRVDDFSDAQHNFVCNLVQQMQLTVDVQKLGYLQQAVVNAARHPERTEERGPLLARTIRDITATEIVFIDNNFPVQLGVIIAGFDESTRESTRAVPLPESRIVEDNEEDVVFSLRSLGLLKESRPHYQTQYYTWTSTANEILTLVRNP